MKGKTLRLVNFLLDSVVYFIFLIIFIQVFKNVIAEEDIKWISGIIYFLYYFLLEYFFGQTIGKMLTKSVVASTQNRDGNYGFRVFVRTLMRLVPLDIFSYLFSSKGLHDRISGTTIVNVA